ncbi:sulfurtransferase FdhD [Rhizobium albus]|nr:sulfurtransferase FdhD [Rhizobium albus]
MEAASRLSNTYPRAVLASLPDEVPVSITCNGSSQAVMMATPRDVEDFAWGFALSEGFIQSPDDVDWFDVLQHDNGIEARFWLKAERAADLGARRRKMAGPVGCGLCGIDSLQEAMRPLPRMEAGNVRLSVAAIHEARTELRVHQPLRDETRGLHAAGFMHPGLGILLAREDVGRHNALDKLCGAMFRCGIETAAGAVIITSRISVDLVQKCVISGIPALIGMSTPTRAAVTVAEAAGLTLAAFNHGDIEIYANAHRISD